MSSYFTPIKTANIEWSDYVTSDNWVAQKQQIYIEGNRLKERWLALKKDDSTTFNIAETAFGTGLNFLLTWRLWCQLAPEQAQLHFISSEINPYKISDLIKSLSFFAELELYSQQLIDCYPVLTPGYHHLSFSDGRVRLTLMLGEVENCYEQLLICGDSSLESELRTTFIDAWFLNNRSCPNEENLQGDSLFKIISMLSKKGSTLSASNVATGLQSRLKNAGFIVKQNNELNDQKQMISACFKKALSCRLKIRNTPWHVNTPLKKSNKKSVIIVGAGLAGCFTAYSLARRGWQVKVVDDCEKAGMGASGNEQAVLFPNLSSHKSYLAQFMLSAFLYAHPLYKALLHQYDLGELEGILLLAHNEKEHKAQQDLKNWLHYYPELGQLMDIKSASDISGLTLDKPGMYIPWSGWINAPALCQKLLDAVGISFFSNSTVDSLLFEEEQWNIGTMQAPILILANGSNINKFNETLHFPVKALKGQMTSIEATVMSKKLKIPICAQGHVLPQINGIHRLGATFHPGIETINGSSKDDEFNLSKLNHIANKEIWSQKVVEHWVGIRASTPDYLPLVGPIPDAEKFKAQFSALASDSKRWIPKAGIYYPGLYVCAGFGSRGLTTIPLAAEWLAAILNNEFTCLPRNLIQAFSPARFLKRDIIRGLF